MDLAESATTAGPVSCAPEVAATARIVASAGALVTILRTIPSPKLGNMWKDGD